MLSQLSREDLRHVLEAVLRGRTALPPSTDRDSWQRARERLSQAVLARLIASADETTRTAIPPLTASMYLDCVRTGQREWYERPLYQRRSMLARLVVGECLEGSGRFLDTLLDLAWAICEESSWAFPAHQLQLADPGRPYIDLMAASTALDLAELDALLGSQLDAALGIRIRYEAERRCFQPYIERASEWWWLSGPSAGTNWTAVCNAGVLGAAAYLEADVNRLARMLEQGLTSVQLYLASFDPTGGTSEGPNYWAYGFGAFTLLAHVLDWRTAGQLRLLNGPRIPEIARYPLRTQLSPGQHVTFSDSRPSVRLEPAHLAFLGRALKAPELLQLAADQPVDPGTGPFGWAIRSLLWPIETTNLSRFAPSSHDWWPGLQWIIARYDPSDPDGLVLAVKGGHNGEMHNHNDVGALIVHSRGESLIVDPGPGRYTNTYFTDRRFEHPATASIGHSVPAPNGYQQPFGAEYRAEVLEHIASAEADRLLLELRDAYPAEANLASLRRSVTLDRTAPAGTIELVDGVTFANEDGTLESALVTFARVDIEPSRVTVHGDH
ncbi:MAG: heparinase II/III family protein, partial [Chloroflexi bacterium]|nr:heparinase II/III family protein [Chloroflexota bacterium]